MKRPVQPKPLSKLSGTLLLVGAGKMGQAMLDGWLARGLAPKRVAIIDPQPATSIKALTRRGVKLNAKPGPKATADAAAIVIAVKPQTAPDAVPPLGLYVGKSTLVLSIMAGYSRLKDGVASLAYVPAIHALLHFMQSKTWMPGTRPGMTAEFDANEMESA